MTALSDVPALVLGPSLPAVGFAAQLVLRGEAAW